MNTLSSTVFHEGFDLIQEEFKTTALITKIINNIFYSTHNSKCRYENGEPYLYLENMSWLAKITKSSSSSCQRTLTLLEKTGYIVKKKTRCAKDCGVRLLISLTSKFWLLMQRVASLKNNKISKDNTNNSLTESDYVKKNESDYVKKNESYNKENIEKETNIVINNNSNFDNKIIDKPNNVKNDVIDSEELKLKTTQDQNKNINLTSKQIKDIAIKENLDAFGLEMIVFKYIELKLYKNTDTLIKDAVIALKRACGETDNLVHCDNYLKYNDVIQKAEQIREDTIQPVQHLAIMQMLKSIQRIHKYINFNLKETANWIIFTVTNSKHHFKNRSFAHCMYSIKKMLVNNGFSKPLGFKNA